MSNNPGEDVVYCDWQQRVTVVVEITGNTVKHIPLQHIMEGVSIQIDSAAIFHHTYRPLLDYPIARALGIYLNYFRYCQAQRLVLEYIKRIIPTINIEEYIMTEQQKVTNDKAATKAVASVTTGPKAKRETAAGMFQELIMEGQLPDEEIFKQVQAKFGLDDNKKWYTSWYRNYLKKKGKEVPPRVITPKPATPSATPTPLTQTGTKPIGNLVSPSVPPVETEGYKNKRAVKKAQRKSGK